MNTLYCRIRMFALVMLFVAATPPLSVARADQEPERNRSAAIDTSDLMDSAHHWWNISDDDHVISPVPGQKKFPASAITEIAGNILRFQKTNGGWAKNYDMQAILTDEQKILLAKAGGATNTTIDNGATHSHIRYLAEAFAVTGEARYGEAARRGVAYLLSAQYANGGWPQFFPVKKGYARYITFNDGAMIGVMAVLHAIVRKDPAYSFIHDGMRAKVTAAFEKGLECILRCQIREEGKLTVWCQQHDEVTLLPQKARTFEPACISNQESADIVEFLMSIDHPSQAVVASVIGAVRWFDSAAISSIRVTTIAADSVKYQYHTAATDKIVVNDPTAPPIWPRFTEPGTHRPLFSNRNWEIVYSLAEVDRERRTGYGWYTYAPKKILKNFPRWEKRWVMEAGQEK